MCMPEILNFRPKLFSQILLKIVLTRCQMLRIKCTKFNFGWGSAPDPTGRDHSAPQTFWLDLGEGKGRKGESGRKKGRGDGTGRGGEKKGERNGKSKEKGNRKEEKERERGRRQIKSRAPRTLRPALLTTLVTLPCDCVIDYRIGSRDGAVHNFMISYLVMLLSSKSQNLPSTNQILWTIGAILPRVSDEWCHFLQQFNVYQHNKCRRDNSIRGWDITISGLE